MIQFEIEDKIYQTKELTALSYTEYKEVMDLLDADIDEIEKIEKVLSILTDIPEKTFKYIDFNSYTQIDWSLLLKMGRDDKILKQKYFINKKTYELINFDDIKFGLWIDLQTFEQYDENLLYVVARLLFQTNDINKLEKFVEDLKTNISLIDLLTIFDAYSLWKISLLNNYKSLFNQPEEYNEEDEDEIFEQPQEEQEEEPYYNHWYDIALDLAGHILKVDDVLDKSITEVLNWLSYQHEKNEETNQKK